jgi:hypothetical protein
VAKKTGINWAAARERWISANLSAPFELEEREAEISRALREDVTIDQIQVRRDMLFAVEPLAPAMRKVAELFVEKVEGAEKWDDLGIKPREWGNVAKLFRELGETGAGLPTVHEVTVDEHGDKVAANRRQMRELEDGVATLAE